MEQSVGGLFLQCCIVFLVMFATSDGIKIESLETSLQARPQDTWLDRWDTFMESFRHTKLSVEWVETPQGHVIALDMPGMDFKSVKIEVLMDKWELRLSAERKKDGKKGPNQRYAERSHGTFLRKLKLPNNVDIKSIESSLVNGVLTVYIAKQFPDGIKSHKVNINDKIVKRGSREEL